MKQGSPCGTFNPGITLLGVVIGPRARSRGETFGSQQQLMPAIASKWWYFQVRPTNRV